MVLVVTSIAASAQTDKEQVKKVVETPALRVPPFMPAVPTNVITTFSVNFSETDRLDASWLDREFRFILTAWYGKGGTNLLDLRLSLIEKEDSFEWKSGDVSCTFPNGAEKLWIEYARKIRSRYQVMGGNLFVEVSPLKYLGQIERLTDGVVLESHLFVDTAGKYRVIDEPYLVEEGLAVDQSIHMGSDGHFFFPVEKKGEKFLLSLEVVGELQKMERERSESRLSDNKK